MASIPGYCPHCGLVFDGQGGIHVSNSSNITISGSRINCPRCHKMARLVDGTFSERGNGLEIVSAPALTHIVLDQLRKISAQIESGELSPSEAIDEVAKVAPGLAKYVYFLMSKGIPVLPYLISLIALYWQYADHVSSSKFQEEVLKLLSTQTEILEVIKDRKDIMYNESIYDKGATPPKPKSGSESVSERHVEINWPRIAGPSSEVENRQMKTSLTWRRFCRYFRHF